MSHGTIVRLPTLDELLQSDASHAEIVHRLKLNLAIRMLCEAIAAAESAGVL